MMKLFEKLFGRKDTRELEQKERMEYLKKTRAANRKLETLRRQVEKDKNAALDAEKNGNHALATSLALRVQNNRKILTAAERDLERTEMVYQTIRAQKQVTDVIATCNELTKGCLKGIDTVRVDKIRAENDTLRDTLQTRMEEMEAMSEGLDIGMGGLERNQAGEEALAELMGTVAKPAAAPVVAKPVAEVPQATVSVPKVPVVDAEWKKSSLSALEALGAE